MGKPRTDPLSVVEFRCSHCCEVFSRTPATVSDAPDQAWHPFTYAAACPKCDHIAHQSGRERGLLKAWANATGPRTDAGKAAVTKNIEGHPTPEEALITRFNAIKTGIYAQTATYFPAKPGQYAVCDACEYYGNECAVHNTLNPPACLKRTELFMKHQIAFDSRDPGMLMQLRAGVQSAVHALLEEMLVVIMKDGGPRIKSPEWFYDKDGGFHLARYMDQESGNYVQITKIEEHPLLKRVMEFLFKNNLTLADMGMTPKVMEDQEILRGHLSDEKENREHVQAFQTRLAQQQNTLLRLLGKTGEPALIEDAEVVSNG